MLSLFILTSVASKPVKAGVEGRYTNGVAAAISVVLFLLMTCSRIIIGKIIDSVGR